MITLSITYPSRTKYVNTCVLIKSERGCQQAVRLGVLWVWTGVGECIIVVWGEKKRQGGEQIITFGA